MGYDLKYSIKQSNVVGSQNFSTNQVTLENLSPVLPENVVSNCGGALLQPARVSLDELDVSLQTERDQSFKVIWGLLRSFRSDVSQCNAMALLQAATREQAVAAAGISLRLTHSKWRVYVSWNHTIKIAVQSDQSNELASTTWLEEQSAAQILVDLGAKLRQAGQFDAAWLVNAAIFQNIAKTVQIGFEIRLGKPPSDIEPIVSGRPGQDFSPIVEIVNEHWAVTTYGLESLIIPYFIAASRLTEIDWLNHLSEKTWTTSDLVAEALDSASRVYLGKR